MAITIPDENILMLHPLNSPFTSVCGSQIYFQGPPLEEGCKPAVIYFALSGRMTLETDPFNQPVLPVCQEGIRVFSWDLPHHGDHLDPHQAMHHWAEEFAKHSSFIADFLALSQEIIEDLINRGYVDSDRLGTAGLSRGGYIAAQLAARMPLINTVLGFSPLTHPRALEETKAADDFALTALAEHLIHKHVRFYIGNRDIRVGTDSCYAFIRKLTETAFENGVRSPAAELILFPSIGHKGHGTPQKIFRDGAEWMIDRLHTKRHS